MKAIQKSEFSFLKEGTYVDASGSAFLNLNTVELLFEKMGFQLSTLLKGLENENSRIVETLTTEDVFRGGFLDAIQKVPYTFRTIQRWVVHKQVFPDYFVSDLIYYLATIDKKAFPFYKFFGDLMLRHLIRELHNWKSNIQAEALKLLKHDILTEADSWKKTFYPDFYRGLFHVFGYIKGQRGCARTTWTIIYKYFGEEICEIIRLLNPSDPFTLFKKHKNHQFFKGVLKKELINRIRIVTKILLESPYRNRKEFYRRLHALPPCSYEKILVMKSNIPKEMWDKAQKRKK